VSTTTDDFALDTFQLRREMDEDSERRRAMRIGEVIGRLVSGETTLAKVMERKAKPIARLKAFSVEPEVMISNTVSDRLTVIEVAALDRPGLLYDVTAALSDFDIDIHSAHISTFGERVVDVFYVTDLAGHKITDGDRQAAMRVRMLAALAGGETVLAP
jgi:[protein-PII] uridylyltransferase